MSRADSHAVGNATSRAAAAILTIEGAQYAAAYLQRLHAGTAQPGELAVVLAFLKDEAFCGACRTLEKALQGVRHG